MKPQNLKQVNQLCAELERLKSHYINFSAIMDEDLPESQFISQQQYELNLSKKIKALEKQIADL